MIIKKPYAFLIRHFRLIHFILLIPIIIVLLSTRSILTFFKAYVAAGYVTDEVNIVSNYLNFLVYPALIFIIIGFILILLLLRSKNKNINIYAFNSLFYFILLILFILIPSILTKYETTDIASTTARVYRDVTNFIYFFQYLIIFLVIIKGLGFDFERFKFIDILDELDLEEEDSDEIEFKIGLPAYKAKRSLRKTFREFKYYVLENKFYLSIICSIVLVISLIFIVVSIINGNRNIKINQIFSLNNFNIKFNSSILTNIDYNGQVIAEDKYYLAVKTYVKNVGTTAQKLDTSDFWLEIAKDKYKYPILDRSGKFIDLGKPYYGEKIAKNYECEYVLVYELTSEEIKSNYTIKILDSITYKEDEIIPKYKIINLTPKLINKISEINIKQLGEEINLENTNLMNTTLKIDAYTITNKYLYTYEFCIMDEECYESTNSVTPDTGSSAGYYTLIKLNGNFNLDENSTYAKYKLGSNNFFKDFVQIEYVIGDNTHIANVSDKTPENSDGIYVIQVPKKVDEASEINLIVTIRDKEFIYKLK